MEQNIFKHSSKTKVGNGIFGASFLFLIFFAIYGEYYGYWINNGFILLLLIYTPYSLIFFIVFHPIYGEIILDKDSITFHNLFRSVTIRFQNITYIKQRAFFQTLVVSDGYQKIQIEKNLEGYSDLFKVLSMKLPKRFQIIPNTFPLEASIQHDFYDVYVYGGWIGFMLIQVAIKLYLSMSMAFLYIFVVSIIVIIIVICLFFVPLKYRFNETDFQFIYLMRTKTVSITTLDRVMIDKNHIDSSFGKREGLRLKLIFTDGSSEILDELHLNYPIDNLYRFLKQMYLNNEK